MDSDYSIRSEHFLIDKNWNFDVDLDYYLKFLYLQEIDYCCISDNYWLGKEKPCLTYGLRNEDDLTIRQKSHKHIELFSTSGNLDLNQIL